MNYLTQINLYDDAGGFTGFGKYGFEGTLKASSSGTLFNMFISSAIGIISVIAFVWFIFIIITGAISIISSGGDKNALESAKKRITSGIIGLVVLIAGLFIVSFIGQFLGIQNILNPGELVRQISQ
jgi:hypothetical protein